MKIATKLHVLLYRYITSQQKYYPIICEFMLNIEAIWMLSIDMSTTSKPVWYVSVILWERRRVLESYSVTPLAGITALHICYFEYALIHQRLSNRIHVGWIIVATSRLLRNGPNHCLGPSVTLSDTFVCRPWYLIN